MKDIENEYNKRFQNQEMDNSDFDVEGLWEAITDNLNGTTPPPTPPNGSPFFKYFGFGALILLIASITYLYLFKVEDSQRLATKKNITKEMLKPQHADIQPSKASHLNKNVATSSSNLDKKIASIKPKEISSLQTKATFDISRKSQTTSPNTKNLVEHLSKIDSQGIPRKSQTSNKATKTDRNKQPIHVALSNTQKQKITKNFKSDQKHLTEIETDNKMEISIAKNISNKIPKHVKTSSNPTKHVDTQNKTEINLIPNKTILEESSISEITMTKKPLKKEGQPNRDADYKVNSNADTLTTNNTTAKALADVAKKNSQLDSLGKVQTPSIKPTKLNNIQWTIGLLGGSNKTFFHFNSKDELAALRNKYEKGTWGASFGVNIDMIWKNKLVVSSGLEYHTLWSKIDYTQNKTWTQDSVLQQVVIQNGEITNMIYDSLTYSSQRQTIWNNQNKTYRIPLEIGYQKHINQWTVGTKVGAIFNFTTSQKGKTFDKEKMLTEYTLADPIAPLKSFQVGLRVSPFISLQVTDRTSLKFEPKWNWYKGQTTDIQEIGLGVSLNIKL